MTTAEYTANAPSTSPRLANPAQEARPVAMRDWLLALQDYLALEDA